MKMKQRLYACLELLGLGELGFQLEYTNGKVTITDCEGAVKRWIGGGDGRGELLSGVYLWEMVTD